jgi:hypothetical protein
MPRSKTVLEGLPGGGVFSTQLSQHSAKAVHSGKVSRMIGGAPLVLARGSALPELPMAPISIIGLRLVID